MIRRCLLLGTAAVAICAGLTGCNREPAKVVFNAVEPPKVTLAPPVGTIKVVYGGRLGDTVIERHVTYPNGDKGSIYYRSEDGTLRHVREVYAGGTVKATATFDSKGDLLTGEVRRPDDSRYMYLQQLENGTKQTTYYGADSNKLMFREQLAGEQGYQDVFYGPDGAALGRVDVIVDENKSVIDNWIDVYPNGRTINQKFRIQFMAAAPGTWQTGQLVSFYNQQEKVEYTQLWRSGSGSWLAGNPMSGWALEQVDEYGWDGKVSRSLFFKEQNGIVQILASKQTQTIWGGPRFFNGIPVMPGTNPGPNVMPGGLPFGFPFIQVAPIPPSPSILPMPRPVLPGPGPDPNPNKVAPPVNNGPTTVEVLKTYRIDEKDRPETVLEKWEYPTPWNPTSPVQKTQRVYKSGTLMLEKQGEKETTHEATENIQEPSVMVQRLKTFSYTEFQEARTKFQREDRSFLGQPDPKDPCRWYLR